MNGNPSSSPVLQVFILAFLTAFLLHPALCRADGDDAQGKTYEGMDLQVRVLFKPLPETMPGSSGDTPEMVALGKKLFFERDLSLDGSQSCNDCHRLDSGRAGVDNLPTSKGVKGASGSRNSPTVLNAGFAAAQFWDGRAPDLAEQAKGPVLNPGEMAMPDEAGVVERLKADGDYRAMFAAAFPGQPDPLTFGNMARAIAAFERTLVTPSRFDRYLKGDREALTAEELRGLKRFMDAGCTECHSGTPVGGRFMRKAGVFHPYGDGSDKGRYAVTGHEEDMHVFKVPMLRNVTLTAPYFHDGKVGSIREAVNLMALIQLDIKLTAQEADDIAAFLRTLEAERPANIDAP